ncbi:MAG: hypothetical protein M1435_01615 [Actinobacteria bacterium]|nr:hypothetical protein [Actinomycetota bacterium]
MAQYEVGRWFEVEDTYGREWCSGVGEFVGWMAIPNPRGAEDVPVFRGQDGAHFTCVARATVTPMDPQTVTP